MSPPLAYFLTWTCYGTWLHGDERGSVDRDHNQLGTPLLPSDPHRQTLAIKRMTCAPVTLLPEARSLVTATIESHCSIRRWGLLALNVRTNHVHVVVNCMETASPERAMGQFKAWSTRQLRHAGFASKEQKVWAEHGSTRWINHADGLEAAIRYVTEGQ